MARPVSMMSAALLTAAAAVAASVLPNLVSPTDDRLTPSLPAVGTVLYQPSVPPSTAPASANMPPPEGIGPQAGVGSGAASGLLITTVTAGQGNTRLAVLAPNNTVAFRPDGSGYAGRLLLRSNSGCEQRVKVEAVASQDRDGANLNAQLHVDPSALTLAPFATANESLRLSLPAATDARRRLPGSGSLRLLAEPTAAEGACKPAPTDGSKEPPNPGYLHVAFSIPETPPDSDPPLRYIFFGSLAASALALGIAFLLLRFWARVHPLGRMGGATWSFQQSWGSNVTIGAGLLGSLLTLVAFPPHPQIMDKSSYSLLQGLFAAVIVLAPLVYGLLRPGVQAGAGGTPAASPQGYVVMFLLAGGLVLWGAMGQVLTLAVLVEEFRRAGSLEKYIGSTLFILASGLFLLLFFYGVRSLYQTPQSAGTAPHGVPPPPPGPLPSVTDSLSEWPLL